MTQSHQWHSLLPLPIGSHADHQAHLSLHLSDDQGRGELEHFIHERFASVPVVIFQFAMSPFEYWNKLAWAGALIVTLFVLFISIFARVVLARKNK